jgi:hypothetical protein
MAIPGFTAEAAFYPTANLYRTLAPGVPKSAQGVTAQQARSTEKWPTWFRDKAECGQRCNEDANRCQDACSNMGAWATYCHCVCTNQNIMCLDDCGWIAGLTVHCETPS